MSTTQNGPTVDHVDDPTPTKVFVPSTVTRGGLFVRVFAGILTVLVFTYPLVFVSGVTSGKEGRFTIDLDLYMTALSTLFMGSWMLLVALVVFFVLFSVLRLARKRVKKSGGISLTTLLLSVMVAVLLTIVLREYLPQLPIEWLSNLGLGFAMLVIAAVPAGLVSLYIPRSPKGNPNH